MRLIFRILLFVILTIGIFKINTIFLRKPIFKIEKIEIIGVDEKLKKSFEILKKEIIDKNINDIDLEKLKEKILKDVRVKEVFINRDSLSTISIKVIPKMPRYCLQYKKKIYIIDESGTIYGYLQELKKKDFIFLVINDNLLDIKKQVKILLKIIDKIETLDLKDEISQIYIENNFLIKIILSNGIVIKTDKDVDMEKYSIGSCLFYDSVNDKKIEYIDLRYKDYIVKYMEDKNGR